MRHSLTKLLAASGSDSPTRSESPAPAATCLLPPDLTRAAAAAAAAAEEEEETAAAAAAGSPGRRQPRGDEGDSEAGRGGRGGVAVRAPSPEEMEEEAIAGAPGEESEDMDFLSGLELADLLDPRQPDWHLEPGLSSPGPLSSSGGGSDSGGLWRGDDDDEAAAAEMQRFSDLLQRLLNGIGGCSGGSDSGSGEKRRRKSPGGGGGSGGNDSNQAATKSPRKAAAAAARLNRLKKKEYVMGLESRVRGLAAENQELRAENRELGKRVQALQEESRYLRAVLANETGLARLLSRLSGVGLRLTTSLFRDSPAGDHDYALPVGKQQQQQQQQQEAWGRPEARTMEDQRDLISNHEQLPMLGQRPGAPESKCSRGALYTGFSVLVALLLAGQATTAYFLYQQQGRLDKLTVTSQNLQLESLRMKLPKPPKPLSKMRVATPMLMQALPIQSLPQGPTQNATEYGNMTQDHVMHLLLEADPLKVYPKLKGSFPENLKHLKNTMETLDWKVFENWMYQWLLFEMSKNSLEKKSTEVPLKALTKCQEEVSRIPDVHPGTFRPQCDENGNYKPLQCYGSTGYCWCVFPNGTEVPHTRSHGHHNCSEPLDMEDLSSGLGMAK